MVAPDREVADGARSGARPRSDLGDRPVVVKPCHGDEVVRGEPSRPTGSVAGGNKAVGVGGVPHHQHPDVTTGALGQCLALDGEYRPVRLQQVAALHALATGPGAYQ